MFPTGEGFFLRDFLHTADAVFIVITMPPVRKCTNFYQSSAFERGKIITRKLTIGFWNDWILE